MTTLSSRSSAQRSRVLAQCLCGRGSIKFCLGEATISVGADRDIQVGVLAAVLGAVRNKRPGADAEGQFESDEAFWSAGFPQNPIDDAEREALFPSVILAVIM